MSGVRGVGEEGAFEAAPDGGGGGGGFEDVGVLVLSAIGVGVLSCALSLG